MQQILVGLALILCIILNILSSRFGFSNIYHGDKDILLPFCMMIFLFYPLLIYLPETHYKFLTFGESKTASIKQTQEDQQEAFPYAFLITLISITFCIIFHRLIVFNRAEPEDQVLNRRGKRGEDQNSSTSNLERNIEYKIESQILKYFLSLAIGLQNIVGAFYITLQQNGKIIKNQLIIFSIFSVIINFAYGYISGWSAVSKDLNDKLSNFVNFGILIGYFLGLIIQNNLIMLGLPCFCCGLMIYSSTLVGLPIMYSNGENQTQDKFRYGSIFTSLLLSVIYHPLCYLLRV